MLFCSERGQPRAWREAVLPRALVSLNALASIACKVGLSEITYQSLSRIWTDYREVLLGLSYCRSVVVIRPDVPVRYVAECHNLTDRVYANVVKDLLVRRQLRRGKRFGDVLCEHLDGSGELRIFILKEILVRLFGRLAPIDELGGAVPRRGPKRVIDEWIIDRIGGPYNDRLGSLRC
jgi:hypothetical protein